jgi:hypothetical protein
MITGLFLFLLGVVAGVMLTKIIRGCKNVVKKAIETKRVNYFLEHQIDYYKPIEKGSYPKEEDV